MTRTRIFVSLSVCTALALSGCGIAASKDAPSATVTEVQGDVAVEAVALQAAGFAEALAEGDPSPSASTGDRQRVRPRAIRKLLRKNTMHGEVVVRGRDGERTVVVQRGEVTAADDSGFTVKSTDGFALSWSYGDPLRVAQDRKKTEKSAVREGLQVAVGGVRDGAGTAARLIVVS